MNDFSPSTPIPLQIRKIIFEKFNDPSTIFTNDAVFENLKQNGDIDPNWIIDDLESYFTELCDQGLMRNIGQNFTTIHFKLFENVEKSACNSCKSDVFLAPSEERKCHSCGASI